MSFFDKVQEAPPDPILGLNLEFLADTHPDKLNLGVGAYRTEEGKPYVLNCVRKVTNGLKTWRLNLRSQAEQQIINSNANKEYFPIDGKYANTSFSMDLQRFQRPC